jgi:hypothetical protein
MKKFILSFLIILIGSLSAQPPPFISVYTEAGNGFPGNLLGGCSEYVPMLNNPFGLANGPNPREIFIADQGNNQIKKMFYNSTIFNNEIVLVAGDTLAGFLDTIASHARFNSPSNLCVDSSGNIFVSDFNNHRIRKISTSGLVTTYAGSGVAGYKDGNADSAQFCYPRGITVDDSGNVFVADSWNHRIRKIDTLGVVTTFAGGGNNLGVGSVGAFLDGADTTARFYTPAGLFYFPLNKLLYVADAYNHSIRAIRADGWVSTLAGFSGTSGYLDGSVSTAKLNTPTEVMVTKHFRINDTILFISDTYNHCIRGINLNSMNLYTEAGTAGPGFSEGGYSDAQFNFPRGLAVWEQYDILDYYVVADFNNHALRFIGEIWESTDDLTHPNYIKIWPQPASSTLHFSEEIQSLKIYDATGKLILSQSYPTGIQNLPIQDWSPGLYRITGTASSGHSLNQSFLIQK